MLIQRRYSIRSSGILMAWERVCVLQAFKVFVWGCTKLLGMRTALNVLISGLWKILSEITLYFSSSFPSVFFSSTVGNQIGICDWWNRWMLTIQCFYLKTICNKWLISMDFSLVDSQSFQSLRIFGYTQWSAKIGLSMLMPREQIDQLVISIL